MKPCVQVHAARERFEAVVGDDHEQSFIVDLLDNAADELVHAVVEFLNHVRALVARNVTRRGMIFFEITPEHVLHAVGRVEHAGAETLLCFAERVEEHAFAVFMVRVALRQERVVVENFFVESPGIFGKAKRRVRTKHFCQIDRVRDWMRDGQVGTRGIDVDRSDINFDFRRDFFQKEASNALCAEAQPGFEFHGEPIRVIADFERDLFRVDFDGGLILGDIGTDNEVGTQFAVRPQWIFWAWDVRVNTIPVALGGHAHSAFTKLAIAFAGSAETEGTLATFEIGHAHAGEQNSGKFLGRKRDGDSDD